MALIRGGMSIPGDEREAPGEEKAPEAVLNRDVGVFLTKAVQCLSLGPCTCTLEGLIGRWEGLMEFTLCLLASCQKSRVSQAQA